MQKINVSEVSRQILSTLKSEGASQSRISSCRVGFAEIVSAFGSEPVTQKALDSFVCGQRWLYEEGNITYRMWQITRRGTELLKFFSETGSLNLPLLPEWEFLHNPLYNKPSDAQLDDPDNIIGLLWRTRQALAASGLAKVTLDKYDHCGYSRLLKGYIRMGQLSYSHEVSHRIVCETHELYSAGKLSIYSFNLLRKAVWIAERYHATGKINLGVVPEWGQRELTETFGGLIERFSSETIRSGRWSEETLCKSKYTIRKLLFQLEDEGIKTLDEITLQFMSGFLTKFASQYTGGLSGAFRSIRAFLKYLYKAQVTSLDLSISIPNLIPPRRNYLKAFSPEETHKLLSVPDTDTPLGKRNYAMMILAVQTGLRAIDIVNLKRGDIDWNSREIRIVQHKTGKALCVSLEAESGNAISEYLLKGRPKCDLPNVFVSHRGAKPLSTAALSTFIRGYMNSAGIDTANGHRAFHSFRRGFGTRLLEAETSLDLLQQMMGYTKIDSAVPYLSIEEQGLKSCALPLLSAKNGGASI